MNNMIVFPQEHNVFDVYFASVTSMNLHPGTTRDKAPGRTLEQCADIALDMIAVRRQILNRLQPKAVTMWGMED